MFDFACLVIYFQTEKRKHILNSYQMENVSNSRFRGKLIEYMVYYITSEIQQ